MIVYISDRLRRRYRRLARELQTALHGHKIALCELSGTNDIWCRDYMPIQRGDGRLVSYTYNPDYLRRGYCHLITDWKQVRPRLDPTQIIESGLVLDGGNVILMDSAAIMTDKVFAENPERSYGEVETRLRSAFRLNQLIIIPTDPADMFGHADGMVAWAGPRQILMNDYRRVDRRLHREIRNILLKAGMEIIPVPYKPDTTNRNALSARGNYINLLILPQLVLVPTYNLQEDQAVLHLIGRILPRHTVVPIDATGIAKHGGSIHCVTVEWKNRCGSSMKSTPPAVKRCSIPK